MSWTTCPPTTPQTTRVAAGQSQRHTPLHPDRLLVAQLDRTWFGIITRQSIRHGTFSSVTALITTIRSYIGQWNAKAQPFTWTATATRFLAKVRLVQTNIKRLVDNNSK